MQSPNAFDQPTVSFVDSFTRSQLEQHPETLLTASVLVSTVSQLSDVPGAVQSTPTAADAPSAYAVAPRDIRLSTVASGSAMNIVFRTGPSGLDAVEGRPAQTREWFNLRRGFGRHRRASQWSESDCSTTST